MFSIAWLLLKHGLLVLSRVYDNGSSICHPQDGTTTAHAREKRGTFSQERSPYGDHVASDQLCQPGNWTKKLYKRDKYIVNLHL